MESLQIVIGTTKEVVEGLKYRIMELRWGRKLRSYFAWEGKEDFFDQVTFKPHDMKEPGKKK